MDENRTKLLALLTAVLAAPKLVDVPGDSDAKRRDIVYTAILHAETILGMIDHRWPRNGGNNMTTR